MKKITAFILALVMLGAMFSIDTMVNATEVTPDPYYGLTFQAVTVESEHLLKFPEIYTKRVEYIKEGEGENVTYRKEEPTLPTYNNYTNVSDIARELKATLDGYPDGTRYLWYQRLAASVLLSEDIIYLDEPIRITKDWLEAFLAEYSRIGGKLDGIIVDVEYVTATAYYIWKDVYNESTATDAMYNPDIYWDIINDSRYATRIRPLLEEQGFKFYPDSSKPEIWGINDTVYSNDSSYLVCRTAWDKMINRIMVDAINESTYEPLIKYYPNASLSDYQVMDSKGWLKNVNDYGNVSVGNSVKAGNTSNYNIYSNRIANGFYGTVTNGSITDPVYTKLPGYNKAVFGTEPFQMVLRDANLFKTMLAATDNGLVNAWIAGYTGDEGRGNVCTSGNTPYYAESIFHVGMMTTQPFLVYLIQGETPEEKDEYDTCLNILDDVLAELTKVAGYADRKPILVPATWNGNFVLSGMYAGGRNIWRLTPNVAVKSLDDFKVQDDDPTFSIDGQTITFPQGTIIEDGEIRNAGSCGYWIETPADVMPVVTAEADRYAKYPSFEENFEEYTAGSTFTSSTALPKACWEVSTGWFGSDVKVQNDGSNNALALTSSSYGTTTVTNVKLPQNITAGDSFAKQQAWEVSFTLPSGIGSSAETKLLMANGDGGIKITGTTVYYYDQSGSYQKMDMPTLDHTVKHTLKRELDFTTMTSSYYIYKASTGELLGKAENVSMKSISLPVTSIGFSGYKLSNNVVLLDDYKLYPTGLTTDFEIYDVEHGYQQDVNLVRTEDTAYRLSWMNATNKDEMAYVYNVETGVVHNVVSMPAGQDGVVTGVVEAGTENVQLRVFMVDDPELEVKNAPWFAFGAENTANTVLNGQKPIYFKTSDTGVVTEGGSENDYNIKVSYPVGGNPTIVLNNANIVSDYAGINIGKDSASTDYHGYPVDIILKGENTITTTNNAAVIESYAIGDITIKGEAGSRLNLSCDLFAGGVTQAAIRSQGNIRLENVNISIVGSGASGEVGNYIRSDNSNIFIDGGSLQIATGAPVAGDFSVLNAQSGNIIIENAANVTIWSQGPNSIFAANNVYLKGSAIKLAADHADGLIFAPQTLLNVINYKSAVSTAMPTVTWDSVNGLTITRPEDAGEYNKSDYTTYKYFSISPYSSSQG